MRVGNQKLQPHHTVNVETRAKQIAKLAQSLAKSAKDGYLDLTTIDLIDLHLGVIKQYSEGN